MIPPELVHQVVQELPVMQAQLGPAAALGAIWLLLSGGSGKNKVDPCSSDAIQQSLAQGAKGAVGGAATGAAVGPWGAAAAGGLQGILGASAAIGCGIQQIQAAKDKLCKNAASVAAQMRDKGFSLPLGFDSWSCDQQMAFIAALGPFGIPMLLAGALVNGAINGLAEELQKTEQALASFNADVNHALGQVGQVAGNAGNQVQQAAQGTGYVNLPGGGGFSI